MLRQGYSGPRPLSGACQHLMQLDPGHPTLQTTDGVVSHAALRNVMGNGRTPT